MLVLSKEETTATTKFSVIKAMLLCTVKTFVYMANWRIYLVLPEPVGPKIAFNPDANIPLIKKKKKNINLYQLVCGVSFWWCRAYVISWILVDILHLFNLSKQCIYMHV